MVEGNGASPNLRTIVGLLADSDRRRTVAALILGAGSVPEVGEQAGLDGRSLVRALERLVSGGLVETAPDGSLRLVVEAFAEAARRSGEEERERHRHDAEELGATPEQSAVLRNFMNGGRLTSVPVSRPKRLVVLDFLASHFDPGVVYQERDVNFMLLKIYSDYASLRRYLVDEGFLERRDGFYWRAGGTVDVETSGGES